MHISCLDDGPKGNWGASLCLAAQARRHTTTMFSARNYRECLPPPGADHYVFMRLAQDAERLLIEKRVFSELHKAGFNVIPDFHTGMTYEDKWTQAKLYGEFMPRTECILKRTDACHILKTMQFPFISKSRTGSASTNVRMIYNETQALQEIGGVFEGGGMGVPHRLGELTQRGYLIWQEFLPGNDYDFRIVATGTKRMILQRFNKPGTPFASGSGNNRPAELTPEAFDALYVADQFFKKFDMKWCGIDVVQDKATNEWKVLETTLGWSMKAYHECRYLGTNFRGADIWNVLLDEITRGVFQ